MTLLFWIAFLFGSLCAEERLIPSWNVASQEGLPSSIVNGSVCAITGEFLDSQIDLVIPGPEPLLLQRTYNSGNSIGGSLGDSWEFAFPNKLTLYLPEEPEPDTREIDYREPDTRNSLDGNPLDRRAMYCCCCGSDNEYQAVINEPSGARLHYKAIWKKRSSYRYFHFQMPVGYTNCGGELSGRTHLKNQTLAVYRDLHQVDVTEPSGDIRIYRLKESTDSYKSYCLSEYLKRNRQKNYFIHDSNKRLHKGSRRALEWPCL